MRASMLFERSLIRLPCRRRRATGRHIEAEGVRGLEVDDELEFGRLLATELNFVAPVRFGRTEVAELNYRHRRLLRARSERPCRRHAAEHANEFPPTDTSWHWPLRRGACPRAINQTIAHRGSRQARYLPV